MTLRKKIAALFEQSAPYERGGRLINFLLIILITLNVIAIILESDSDIHQRFESYFWAFEIFSVMIFTLEYLARVWSSIDLTESKDTSPVLGRLKYMFSPIALIDLVAILPFYLSLYMAMDLRFLRVLRMLRLFKLTRYSPALGALLDVIQKESEALIAAVIVLLMMLVISASGIYLLEHEIQPEAFGSIPKSMWWAMVTLTTVGYGDVVPLTTLGKVFGGLIGLIGVGMVALPAAILASGFAENLNQRRFKYNNHIKHILNDGKINEHERWELEEIRKELGLEREDAMHLLDTMIHRGLSFSGKCPHCGKYIEKQDGHG